jgi:hypothetical protein
MKQGVHLKKSVINLPNLLNLRETSPKICTYKQHHQSFASVAPILCGRGVKPFQSILETNHTY